MSQRSNRWECRKRNNRQIGDDYDYMKMNIVIPREPGSCTKAVPGYDVRVLGGQVM
jgi:hypothetical protein